METISPTVRYIKSEMIRRAVSIPELAERIGRPQSTIWRIITGESNPKLDTIEQIFEALGLPPIGKSSLDSISQKNDSASAGGPAAD